MKKSTVVRTIALAIVLLNMVLKAFGYEPINIDESYVLELFEMLISVATIILCWWKNNSFTENAKKADEFLEELRRFDEEVYKE